jgi:hypothetical protein
MRFLDLDLDFFLNENAYCCGCDGGRLGPEYKPWSVSKVRHFLEDRCGLSPDVSVQGRTVESHDGILDFWRTLIESNKLKVPFEVIHIDAHPDLWVADGLYMTSEFLYIDSGRGLAMLEKKNIHPGNYLTFAIVYGWVGSLVWITLRKHLKKLPKWNGDARSGLMQFKKREDKSSSIRDLPTVEKERCVSYKILPWHKFRTSEPFDYIALSRSPNSTPPESDVLIPVIEGYMKQI